MSKRIAFTLGAITMLVVLALILLWGPFTNSLSPNIPQATANANTAASGNASNTASTASSVGAQAAQVTTPSTLMVNGTGSAFAAPDVARIQIGVQSRASTAQQAVADNSAKQAAVIDALKKKGVDAKDIQTINFSVNAERRATSGGGDTITGYVASNMVRVTIRKIDQVGAILDAVVTAGANQIYGISFGLSDPDSLMNEARNKAVANARAKAEGLAKAAGVKLGKVITINESFGVVSPRGDMMAAPMAEARSVPIETGETQVTAQVQVTFAIE